MAQSVTLTFTGKDANNSWVQLDRVIVTNLTRGWQETIYWPDTTLTMQNSAGMDDFTDNGAFALSQNNPNPFNGTTDAILTVADAGVVVLEIADVNGRVVEMMHVPSLQAGVHQFRVTLSAIGTFVMIARQNGKTSSIKMVNNGGGNGNGIEYVGIVHVNDLIQQPKSGTRGNTSNPFNLGDMMEYVGYAILNDVEIESVPIRLEQGASQLHPLFFTACPGKPTLTDIDGNVYHTVQIGQQCWMKENLRTTKYADGTYIFSGIGTSTTIPRWYYPDGNATNKPTNGLLYNWLAVMKNAPSSSDNPSGVQGICPDGWHVPSDAEWAQLTNYVSDQSQFVCGSNTTNIAKSFAGTTEWQSSITSCAVGNVLSDNNATGFNALPAGFYCGTFYDFGDATYFWSTTEAYNTRVRYHVLNYDDATVCHDNEVQYYGFSVRCLSSTTLLPTVVTANITSIDTYSAIGGGDVTSDGGAVAVRGVCWSITQNPTVDDSHTIDGTGTGSFASSITGLTPGTTYYVRAYATNIEGTAYGNQVSFTTPGPCPGSPIVIDIDGNTYNTVQVGTQCWMKENLRTTRYANGTPIMAVLASYTTPCYWYPNGDVSSVSTYGLLYNWYALVGNSSSSSANPSGVQGVCPTGWHVPSDAEWTQLTDYVSSQSPYVCGNSFSSIAKALASTEEWHESNYNCVVGNTLSSNNATGFSALPGGKGDGCSGGFGYDAYLWSSTECDTNRAFGRSLKYNRTYVSRESDFHFTIFYSVRCLRDTTSIPIVVTTSVTPSDTAAICCYSVTSEGNSSVIANGVCWSLSPNPTIADSYTIDGCGSGNFISNITGLSPNTTCYVRAYATNSAGTAYGNQVAYTEPCPGMSTLADIDGNVYYTVQIGQQCWMRENLRTTMYADGTSISEGNDASSTVAYWYYPEGDASNKPIYGLLYNWPAVMKNSSTSYGNPSGVQGVCPDGWHVPSDMEWAQLIDYVGSQSQYVCGSTNTNIAKALASTIGWCPDTTACAIGNVLFNNNTTGFNALPVVHYGFYNIFGYSAYFWSTTERDSNYAYGRSMYYCNPNMGTAFDNKSSGYSVRCLRN